MTVASVVECVNCTAANDGSATRCGECGRPLGELRAPAQRPRILYPVVGCTCDGIGDCTHCVQYLYDNNLPPDGSRWE